MPCGQHPWKAALKDQKTSVQRLGIPLPVLIDCILNSGCVLGIRPYSQRHTVGVVTLSARSLARGTW